MTSAGATAPPMSAMQMPKLEYPEENNYESRYATLQRSNTLRSTMLKSATLGKGATLDQKKNFWEIKGYKNTIKRTEYGHTLGNKLVSCLLDRARIEDDYTKSLKQWNSKWKEYLETSSMEYGSCKASWLAMLQTGDDIATIHSDLSEKIQQTPVGNIKSWLKEKYQKAALNSFKQVNEFEADFETAQKSWKGYFEKMEKRQKEYYACVKKERSALTKAEMARSNIDKTDVQKKKAAGDHEIAIIETERAKKSYIDEIEKLRLYRPTYEQEMKAVFKKTDDFEEARKNKFEGILKEAHALYEEQLTNPQYKIIMNNFMDIINSSNHKDDIKWWEEQYGAGMSLIQPEFEEFFAER